MIIVIVENVNWNKRDFSIKQKVIFSPVHFFSPSFANPFCSVVNCDEYAIIPALFYPYSPHHLPQWWYLSDQTSREMSQGKSIRLRHIQRPERKKINWNPFSSIWPGESHEELWAVGNDGILVRDSVFCLYGRSSRVFLHEEHLWFLLWRSYGECFFCWILVVLKSHAAKKKLENPAKESAKQSL